TGVAKPNAHGHAIISTVTAARNAVAGSPKMSHAANVINAMTNTMGTNTAEIRSANRAIGAFSDWARDTSSPIWASVVSAPVRVARTTRRPEVLIVAPVTVSFSETSTGTDSPVMSEVSMAE